MRNFVRWTLLLSLVPATVVLCQGCWKSDAPTVPAADSSNSNQTQEDPVDPKDSGDLIAERLKLDETVWANEVEAQKYETAFVGLWDRIRSAKSEDRLNLLAKFPFKGALTFGTAGTAEEFDAGISLTKYLPEPTRSFDASQWSDFVQAIQDAGISIVQTEWHHSRFLPASESSSPKSTIAFTIHAVRVKTQTTFAVKGNLDVQWLEKSVESSKPPIAESISVSDLTLQQRSKGGLFTKLFTAEHGPDDFVSAYPVLVYDLNNDGRSDIVLPRWNRVYWNQGGREFMQEQFLENPVPIWEAGILSDFNGDGNADFLTVGKDGSPYFYAGTSQGKFPNKPTVCADVLFDMPTAITAGDVDGDGDLDVWMTQYKLSFAGGQMPTPFYDANDGFPSYLLKNDGKGSFTDATEKSGLGKLRNRRSYSASIVDLDGDGDLDLFNVSDYAGLDIYRNLGDGSFELATDSYVKERDFFGMGHTIGDYNDDGLLDFYVIGMSSTTARRLDRLKLGRDDRPDVHPMRATMGYGNRLYFGDGKGGFREDSNVAPTVARTGWSWGATSFDFDLDGDLDIYVANGHRSGKSSQDYCSTFWRHDIYTGDSNESPEILKVFQSTLMEINQDEISWNGYEKNVLFVNQEEKPDRFTNSSFMFGSAYAFDARSVISDDFDADGWPDLVVAQSSWNGRGFALSIHVFGNDIKTGEANNWINVRLKESAGPGFSPNGAKVEITDESGHVQTRWIVSGDSFLAQHAPMAHFGLGKAKQVKLIEVTWPNGKKVSHETGLEINSTIILSGTEIQGPAAIGERQ
ncbi:MAG: hypothetical protein ACI87E_004657 [Mariniblastus sp.]|jgi:hypothetical protein